MFYTITQFIIISIQNNKVRLVHTHNNAIETYIFFECINTDKIIIIKKTTCSNFETRL